jgi:hypothetical protein
MQNRLAVILSLNSALGGHFGLRYGGLGDSGSGSGRVAVALFWVIVGLFTYEGVGFYGRFGFRIVWRSF